MSLEGHVLSKGERFFKGVFYFTMSGRNWTVEEIEKKKERVWGLLLQCAQHLGSIKTPSGESFLQAWWDGGQGSREGIVRVLYSAGQGSHLEYTGVAFYIG